MNRTWTWVCAVLGISAFTTVVLIVVYRQTQEFSLGASLADLRWWAIPAALGLHVAAHLAWAARQAVLARGAGWRLGLLESWGVISAGVFGAAVTPARVGGDAVRLALLSRKQGPGTQLVLADRALDLLFFVGAGMTSVALLEQVFGQNALWLKSLVYLGIGLFIVILFLVVLLVARPTAVTALLRPFALLLGRLAPVRAARWRAKGGKLILEVRDGLLTLLRERPGPLVLAALFTLATWAAEFSILWLLLLGLGTPVPYASAMLAAVLLNIVVTVPLTPGGSGVAELAALALYAAIGDGVTPVFVLVWRGVTYYYDLAVGGAVTVRHARDLLP